MLTSKERAVAVPGLLPGLDIEPPDPDGIGERWAEEAVSRVLQLAWVHRDALALGLRWLARCAWGWAQPGDVEGRAALRAAMSDKTGAFEFRSKQPEDTHVRALSAMCLAACAGGAVEPALEEQEASTRDPVLRLAFRLGRLFHRLHRNAPGPPTRDQALALVEALTEASRACPHGDELLNRLPWLYADTRHGIRTCLNALSGDERIASARAIVRPGLTFDRHQEIARELSLELALPDPGPGKYLTADELNHEQRAMITNYLPSSSQPRYPRALGVAWGTSAMLQVVNLEEHVDPSAIMGEIRAAQRAEVQAALAEPVVELDGRSMPAILALAELWDRFGHEDLASRQTRVAAMFGEDPLEGLRDMDQRLRATGREDFYWHLWGSADDAWPFGGERLEEWITARS